VPATNGDEHVRSTTARHGHEYANCVRAGGGPGRQRMRVPARS
jgi:hypothetical protein